MSRGSPDAVLTWTEVDASDDGRVAEVLFELAALGKSVSGDYEPAGSKRGLAGEFSGTTGAPRIQSLCRFCSP